MALPLALIVITGEIDLSVASILGLSGVVMAELFMHGWPIWPAMGAALVLGAVAGAFNGFLVTRPRPAVARGHDRHADALPRHRAGDPARPTRSRSSQAPYSNIGVLPIRGTQLAVVDRSSSSILAVVFGVVLHATPLGRSIYAIGAGQEAAFFAGIRVKRIKFWLFVALRLAWPASPGSSGRCGSPRRATTPASGWSCYVVTIVLLGGISIFGGPRHDRRRRARRRRSSAACRPR